MNRDMTQTLRPSDHDAADDVKITRWVATIAGLLGFVLSVLTPLLPVVPPCSLRMRTPCC